MGFISRRIIIRITYKLCEKFAKHFSIPFERSPHSWEKGYLVTSLDSSTTTTCETIEEAWEEIHEFAGRKPMQLTDASELMEKFYRDVLYTSCEFKLDIPIYRDSSGYVFVDGEEGDYGKILYFDSRLRLLATRHIKGGDNDWMEWTAVGVATFRPILLTKVKQFVRSLLDGEA